MKGWGSLQPPSLRDIRGRGGATKGLSAPPPPLTHLVVLDFEWTADDRRRMEPCSEITQFPSVLVRLDGHASAVIDQFDTFVRPVYNPKLTPFAVGLTAIEQADVDAAPVLAEVLPRYLEWLRGHGLVDAAGRRLGSWCVCTWSDADIGGQLSTECRHKEITLNPNPNPNPILPSPNPNLNPNPHPNANLNPNPNPNPNQEIAVPACFDAWVDLKLLYRRHYRTAPSGGLRACVERLGLTFEGRAHNGLVDARNTAAIVVHTPCPYPSPSPSPSPSPNPDPTLARTQPSAWPGAHGEGPRAPRAGLRLPSADARPRRQRAGVPSCRLTRRPPSAVAALHGHPCHCHGPGRSPAFWAAAPTPFEATR